MKYFVLTFFIFITTSSLMAESELVDCKINRHAFPILKDNEGKVVLCAELSAGIYSESITKSKIDELLKGLPEVKKLTIPEYLIIKEFNESKEGNIQKLLLNYKGEKSKRYAKSLFSNISELRDYNRDNVKDILFQTKTVFGDLIRIKYKRIARKGHSFGWVSFLKKIDGRYYFVHELNDNHILHTVAGAFPYWEWEKHHNFIFPKELLIADLGYSSPNPNVNNDYSSTSVRIGYAIKRFPNNLSLFNNNIFPLFEENVRNVFRKAIKVYQSNDKNGIVAMWEPKRRKVIEKLIDHSKHSVEFFNQYSDIQLKFYFDYGKECFVYFRPVINKDEYAPLRVVRLSRENGKLFLTDKTESIFADKILSSEEMAKVLAIQMGE